MNMGTFLNGRLSEWPPLLVGTFTNEWASQEAGYLRTTVHNVQVEQPVVVVNHTQSLSLTGSATRASVPQTFS